jgi:hypothetical protein
MTYARAVIEAIERQRRLTARAIERQRRLTARTLAILVGGPADGQERFVVGEPPEIRLALGPPTPLAVTARAESAWEMRIEHAVYERAEREEPGAPIVYVYRTRPRFDLIAAQMVMAASIAHPQAVSRIVAS